jgi:hypothetical protein
MGIGFSGVRAQRSHRARRPHFKAAPQRAVKDVEGVQRQASVELFLTQITTNVRRRHGYAKK